jgi:type I restriction enzyme M protein
MNKQQLASKIWESANKMRSKIEANEYKDYILGFIFYKFLSDKEVQFLQDNDFGQEDIESLSEEDTESVKFIQKSIGYFIAYKDLFSTWLKKGKDFDVSDVRDALSAFSRLINDSHKKVFEDVFETLQTGLSKLGDSSGSQTKSISDLLQLIKDIPMDGKQGYDVLGFIYEYLISMFAANAGKKAGEFYTPHEVSLLMSEIVANHLKDRNEIKIYDPTSGSGSLLINIGRSVAKHIKDENNIKYYAQELKENTYNLTRMNLVMRGILPDNIVTRNGDTLAEDWPYFDENDPIKTYNPLYVDAVVSNPPYSQQWDPKGKDGDPRFSRYGIAPKAKADYAFLLHDLFHVKPEGIMTIVLPHGVLFRGGSEGEIRKNLIEQNNIDTIIGLPANIFFGTGIPTIIMVVKQKRINTDVLIIDASKGFIKVGKNNKLQASDIKKIVDTVIARKDIPKFAKVVSREEIRQNDYNLNIPRYVDSSETAESWDIYATMFGGIPKNEIAAMDNYWQAFPGLKKELFTYIGTPYPTLTKEDVKKIIEHNADVMKFIGNFAKRFESFPEYLQQELIGKMSSLPINGEEAIISTDIFKRMKELPLLDKYRAYQVLDEAWIKIAVDIEIIQTEGFSAVKQVDPRMVIKTKHGKEEEVQEGWLGHILPFELVQNKLLQEPTAKLQRKNNRISEIASEYEEIISSITDEDKETYDVFNEAKDTFDFKGVAKVAKQIQHDIKIGTKVEEDSVEKAILHAEKVNAEEKVLKSEVKKETLALHLQTKDTIEELSDAEAKEILKAKWFEPIIGAMNALPNDLIKELVSKVQSLSQKYEVTYSELENDISKTQGELCVLMDQLTGNEFDMKGIREFQSLLKGK